MKNNQLQELLKQYPDDMDVRILINQELPRTPKNFDMENILLTSETTFIDKNAPENKCDTEGGKVELGNGIKYLLINPLVY